MKECFEALSADTEINLFISYKWNEMSEKEADKVCEWLSTVDEMIKEKRM